MFTYQNLDTMLQKLDNACSIALAPTNNIGVPSSIGQQSGAASAAVSTPTTSITAAKESVVPVTGGVLTRQFAPRPGPNPGLAPLATSPDSHSSWQNDVYELRRQVRGLQATNAAKFRSTPTSKAPARDKGIACQFFETASALDLNSQATADMTIAGMLALEARSQAG